MAAKLTCPQGHYWAAEAAGVAGDGSTIVAHCCPICGEAAVANGEMPSLVHDASARAPDVNSPLNTLDQNRSPLPTEIFDGAAQKETEWARRAGSTAIGPSAAAAEPPPYEILGELGRGGMGVVYKVRQRSLGRIVALKTVMTGTDSDAELLTRFHAEARAVAALQHPNIVQIHEVGQWNGRPYLLLEFMPGGSLADTLRSDPLPAREAARIVEILARAIHFAHGRGIVHRDLKPANVLLSEEGTPKITDFGLAKQLQVPGQTQTGAILGTPSYMAPEQAGGVMKTVGPPCDVYSLGAILYELVTCRPPFRGQDAVATILQVLADDPISPRLMFPSIPRDLETIILKCLEKSPRRRYESAAALADDLARFLDGRPIVARPSRPWQRVAKWARRRPSVAALVGVVILATVAIISFGAWKNAQLSESFERTDRARQRAEANFSKALIASETRLNRAGEDYRLQLQDELDFYRDIYSQEGNDPEVRFEKALARKQAGNIWIKLHRFDEARSCLETSLQLLNQLVAEAPDSLKYGRELAAAHASNGNLEEAAGNEEVSEAEFRKSLDLFKQLGQKAPDDALLRSAQGNLWNNLALLESRQKRFDEAEASFRRAIDIRLQLAEQSEGEAHWIDDGWHDLAITYANISSLYLRTNRPQDAVNMLVKSQSIYDKLPRFRADQSFREGQAMTSMTLAAAYRDLKRFEESQAAYSHALASYRKLTEDYLEVPAFSQRVAEVEASLGLLSALAGHPAAESIEHYQAAIRGFERLATYYPKAPEYSLAVVANLYNLRLLHLDSKRSEAAQQDWERISETLKHAVAVGNLSVSNVTEEPSLVLLRADAAFAPLLRELNR
ncbi:MAG TPA: protein kinase [Pirellulales bacterium]|jgi:serine/threonine protein kinase|nr:protein kinase [Pirellulales bacterium]